MENFEEREGSIKSSDGEEFTIKQEGQKVMVKIPKARRIDEKPENLWAFDNLYSGEDADKKVIEIVKYIIETFPKKE